MKSIIYITLLMFSSNLFAQNSIASDPLYLQYEKEYLAYANSTDVKELLLLDNITSEFYLNFNDAKALRNYQKSKDQRRWLERNISKTSFPNASTAVTMYDEISSIQKANEERSLSYKQALDQLLKKYEGTLVWDTFKSRQLK